MDIRWILTHSPNVVGIIALPLHTRYRRAIGHPREVLTEVTLRQRFVLGPSPPPLFPVGRGRRSPSVGRMSKTRR